jgi:DNA-binding transcriptional regulator LsrR (DeoR family)
VLVAGEGRRGVGAAAARLYEESAAPQDTVVLDGGWTVAEFVNSLQVGLLESPKIAPLCADPSSYPISAYELMAVMAQKYDSAECYRLPHHHGPSLRGLRAEVCRRARQARFIFLGAGPWQPGFTAFDFVTFLGLSQAALARRHPGIVALCGYCAVNAEGRLIRLKQVEERMPRALTCKEIRARVGAADCTVALLVAGKEKLEPLIATLKARLCNLLVIDRELGQALAERIAAPRGL